MASWSSGSPDQQLPGRCDDAEGCGVCPAQGVGQRVVVVVLGGDRVTDAPAGRRVLGHPAHPGLAGREGGRLGYVGGGDEQVDAVACAAGIGGRDGDLIRAHTLVVERAGDSQSADIGVRDGEGGRVVAAQCVGEGIAVRIGGGDGGDGRGAIGVLGHRMGIGGGRERRRPVGGDDEDPVTAAAVRGGDVEGAVGADHGRPQPVVRRRRVRRRRSRSVRSPVAVNSNRRSDLSVSDATARRPSQAPHQLPSRKTAPLVPRAGLPGRPLGLDGVGELHEVRHRDALVVSRHGVPAGVAAGRQQVDLVVDVRAVLDRPHLGRAGPQRQPLHVAMAGGVDRRGRGRIVRGARARGRVDAQDLAAARERILRDRSDPGVARRDPQVALGTEAQAAASLTAAGGDAAHEGIGDAGGRRIGGVDRPGDHFHPGPAVALAGVEAAVGRRNRDRRRCPSARSLR